MRGRLLLVFVVGLGAAAAVPTTASRSPCLPTPQAPKALHRSTAVAFVGYVIRLWCCVRSRRNRGKFEESSILPTSCDAPAPPCNPQTKLRSPQRTTTTTMVQSLNLPGILAVAQVVRSPSLLLPHVAVPHIGFLDFQALKDAGTPR